MQEQSKVPAAYDAAAKPASKTLRGSLELPQKDPTDWIKQDYFPHYDGLECDWRRAATKAQGSSLLEDFMIFIRHYRSTRI